MAEGIHSDPRWAQSWQRALSRPSPFGNETGRLPNGYYEPSPQLFSSMRSDSKVLVIGAGGLGSEILKNLALSGLTDIHVIDKDTIDITNLNRQFLFRLRDVGQSKAEVAAKFVMSRVPGCNVTAHVCWIQDKDLDFYRQFKVVIAGLDNIDARRWLNSTLCNLVEYDEEENPKTESIIPLIDGGTEAFGGHARVIIPKFTACFECTIELFPPPKTFQLCTIASTPRNAEHCIAYAYILQWEQAFPGRKIDTDSAADMTWIYERALERAAQFNIKGVTYFKTLGVVKTIIPAIASTNAVIAANCSNEAIKLLSFGAQTMNTYYMYMGGDGLYSLTYAPERHEDCCACGDSSAPKNLRISRESTLEELIQRLAELPAFQLKSPSLSSESASLFMQKPESLRKSLEGNLQKPLKDLVYNGETVAVTDPCLPELSLTLQIEFLD